MTMLDDGETKFGALVNQGLDRLSDSPSCPFILRIVPVRMCMWRLIRFNYRRAPWQDSDHETMMTSFVSAGRLYRLTLLTLGVHSGTLIGLMGFPCSGKGIYQLYRRASRGCARREPCAEIIVRRRSKYTCNKSTGNHDAQLCLTPRPNGYRVSPERTVHGHT